jgi:Uma2 family endonuclease
MATLVTKRRFTVWEYHRLAEVGILREDDRVELLEGEIFEMSPISSRHASCVTRLNHLLQDQAKGRAIVSVQNPIRLSDYSEPQPDVALLVPRTDFYRDALPTPRDVLLVIEVCETSGEFDRHVKLPLYAKAGIPEVWIVDLSREQIEVYRDPKPEGYQQSRIVGRGQTLTAQLLALELPVAEILG